MFRPIDIDKFDVVKVLIRVREAGGEIPPQYLVDCDLDALNRKNLSDKDKAAIKEAKMLRFMLAVELRDAFITSDLHNTFYKDNSRAKKRFNSFATIEKSASQILSLMRDPSSNVQILFRPSPFADSKQQNASRETLDFDYVYNCVQGLRDAASFECNKLKETGGDKKPPYLRLPKKFQPFSRAREHLIYRLMEAYKRCLSLEPCMKYPNSEEAPTGPFIAFVQAALEAAGRKTLTEEAIKKPFYGVLKNLSLIHEPGKN